MELNALNVVLLTVHPEHIASILNANCKKQNGLSSPKKV